ncbi:MAG TPA: alpha/beta hydrolase [Candidatus Acidoferrales bacterium]|nr:alpha/beta hydrolase [Candidatus Acidoferrales bacterium]
MKVVIVILSLVAIALSAATLIPAPNLTVLPFTIVVPELAPWLAVFLLLACAAALRFHRRLVPCLLAAAFIVAWPLARIPGVEQRMAAQLSPVPALGLPTLLRPMNLFRQIDTGGTQPETLPLNIRYYRPKAAGAHPTLIEIYGGAWQRGSPEDNRQFASYMASKGYAVFAIDYRHAPAARFPAQIEDVRAAIAFVHSNAERYQADPGRIALCGRSAGGQLALLAAYEAGPVPIRAVISFYGPSDLARGYSELPSPDPIDVRRVLETYLGGSPSQVSGSYRTASPVTYANRPLPPTLLIQGARDHIVKPEFARSLQQGLIASGNRAVLLELPWAEHAFDAVFQGIGNRLALRYVEAFLVQAMAPR